MRVLERLAAHPVSVLTVWLAVLLFGAVAAVRLEVDLLPRLSIPVARVVTEYASLPAQEVEQLVTVPLENALSSVKGVKQIDSLSKQGLSAVALRLEWGANIDKAAVEVREKIDSIYPYLPHDMKKPVVFTEELAEQPVLFLAVFPRGTGELAEVSAAVEKELKTRLLEIDGVASLDILGAVEPEVQVEVEAAKLAGAGLSLREVAEAIGASVFDFPVGTLTEGELEVFLKAGTGIRTLEALRGLPLGRLRLEDVAEVRAGSKEATSFFHADGRRGIGVRLYKSGGIGTLNASNRILGALKGIRAQFSRDLELEIVEDAAEAVRASLRGLGAAVGLGAAACALVLFVFFKERRVPLAIVAAIPFCMAAVFLFMYLFRISLNIMSLSGIAIGVGMVVDNSIVVLENLLRRRAASPADIASAVGEMGSSTFGSTVTTLLVFVPILFLPGLTGALFRELALTISVFLSASFLLSLTLTPALYRLMPPRAAPPEEGGAWARLARFYRRLLEKALSAPTWTAAGAVMVIAGGVLLLVLLPKQLMPRIERGKLEAEVRLRRGVTAAESEAVSERVEEALRSLPEVRFVYASSGYEAGSLRERAEPGRDLSVVRLGILFASGSLGGAGIVARALEGAGSLRYSLHVPAQAMERVLGEPEGLEFVLRGSDRERLVREALRLAGELEAQGLARSSAIDTAADSPEARLLLSRESLAASGLLPIDILEVLDTAVSGRVVARLPGEERETDIRVRLRRADASSRQSLQRIRVSSPGGSVELASLGEFADQRSYGELCRRGRQAAVSLRFIAQEGRWRELARCLVSLQSSERTLMSESALAQSAPEIVTVFVLALVLMYLVLAAQFESFLLPLVLLVSLPLSTTGSLLALWLAGASLNLNSFLGLLILQGTTINTAILLCASFRGGGPDRILAGSEGRLKPVAATVLTTVVALLPIVANPAAENAVQRHTAIPVVGGLLFGTLATLFAFPVLYRLARGRGPR